MIGSAFKQTATSLFFILLVSSCSVQRQISKGADGAMLSQPEFATAHVGISVFDPATNTYLYNHNADKLFVPASNIKLFTCYAAMKHLGDSILAAYYRVDGDQLTVTATGDPTFLHPDFTRQPLFDLMKDRRFSSVSLYTPFDAEPLGAGWSWDDYSESYMAERDPFPLYGNMATFTFTNDTLTTIPPHVAVIGKPAAGMPWTVERNLGGHYYFITNGKGTNDAVKTMTMAMERGSFAASLLQDTLHKPVETAVPPVSKEEFTPFYSQPTDSLLHLMMNRSDNFLAEQTLLMVSNKMLGVMNDRIVIDSLLQSDFCGFPQKPRWVDGSGLSRYNLASPKDFVWLLNNMKNEFGLERMKLILPTGNTGTLSGLYSNYEGKIFAKTGTLSNHVALSGFIVTKQNRTLLFSVLVSNHVSTALTIRKAIETFLVGLIEKF